MITTRNLNSSTPGDTTTGTTTTGAGPAVAMQANTPVAVQFTLVGGTSATGQLEGSVDGTHWGSLQAAALNLAAPGTAVEVLTSPLPFLRWNTLTNAGGGTVYAYLSF